MTNGVLSDIDSRLQSSANVEVTCYTYSVWCYFHCGPH